MKRRGLKDEVEEKKTIARLKSRKNREGNPVSPPENFIGKAIARASQRTARLRPLAAVRAFPSESPRTCHHRFKTRLVS